MTTPARKQYLEIKRQHQDAILLYQIGDFFETFDEDAVVAARELNIVLTSRSYGPHEQVPLAGVPVHALDTYSAKLIGRGYKVAICEQVSPPGRGLVQREVTRILTPGTLTEPGLTPPLRDNYLASVVVETDSAGRVIAAGFAYAEVSAAVFACTEWVGHDALDAVRSEAQRVAPAEIVYAETSPGAPAALNVGDALSLDRVTMTPCSAQWFDREDARDRLLGHFGVRTLAAFGCESRLRATTAAGAILAYLARMNPAALRQFTDLTTYDTAGFVEIDPRTWRALEVTEPFGVSSQVAVNEPGRPRTLLQTLDETLTPMGARMLHRMLRQPLKSREILEQRLDAVAVLVDDESVRQRLGAVLAGTPDLERVVARVARGSATARELHTLRARLLLAKDVRRMLRTVRAGVIHAVCDAIDPCVTACDLIARAVGDPWQGEERIIRPGFDPELDDLTRELAEARAWIAGLEVSERQRTGIKSLKVTYNAVFGYAIEVTRPNLDRVPADYQRRQTLAHAERYVTPGLLEREKIILRAEERILASELRLFADVLASLSAHQVQMRRTAQALAQLDVWLSLAQVASVRRYVRPELSDSLELRIAGGRHPVIEAALEGGDFIANDTLLGDEDQRGERLALLTGPNMAGKSTYLRQVALITLMAQVGSFVPATAAHIGLVDRIFTRVGAQDDLAAGVSTFMSEMVETGFILRHATERSLVILDEIGRGTSADDGLAIARAVIEYLHTVVRARTVFATHYHELADLAQSLPTLGVWHMAVTEDHDQPVFLHRLRPGPSHRSYGVHVASVAGVPAHVVSRARELLGDATTQVRESPGRYGSSRGELVPRPAASTEHAAYREAPERDLTLALAGLNLAATTPIEALNILFSLQQRALSSLRAEGG